MKYLSLAFIISSLVMGCDSKESGSSKGAGSGASAEIPEKFDVQGSLSLEAASEAIVDSKEVENKLVQLVSDTGEVIAEGRTDVAGAYSLQVDASSLSLTSGTTTTLPKFAKLKSVFLSQAVSTKAKLDSTLGDAVGFKNSIIIDARDFDFSKETPVLGAGLQKAKKIGAIVGQIELETQEDPTGIEVYVPGTTHIAKTDEKGQFILGFLPSGTYTLRADRDGFGSIVWESIQVKRNETTHLDSGKMVISNGPEILSFKLKGISDDQSVAQVELETKGANKFRLSLVSDFSDSSYQPIKSTEPKFTVSIRLPEGDIETYAYVEVADSDGFTAKGSLQVDKKPPSSGQIVLANGKNLVNTIEVALDVTITEASKMKFSESVEGLKDADWVEFADSHSYTLSNASDGFKTIYASFADASDNKIGENGEIYVAFTLDTQAPDVGKVQLLAPASPTGAFNTPLSWKSELAEKVSYVVEVHQSSTYNDLIRTMQTDELTARVSPPLENSGTYHWRLKAVDEAGNSTAWVTSSDSNYSFTVQILAQAYHANKDIKGDPDSERYFAREIEKIGDINGDGVSEIAISVLESNYQFNGTTCSECGKVEIYDHAADKIVATILPGMERSTGIGHRVVACDINDDSKKEIILSAPGVESTVDGVVFRRSGALFAYKSDGQLLASYYHSPASSLPVDGYDNCALDDGMGTCLIYGWQYWGNAIENVPYYGDGRNFGWDVSCNETSVGGATLIVGEPNYHNGAQYIGRVHEMQLSGNTFTSTQTVDGAGDKTAFGSSVALIPNFKYGSCNIAGPTLAIGEPKKLIGGEERGSFSLYQLNAGSWTLCETIDAEADDQNYARFGFRLKVLGDLADDPDDIAELAVSGNDWSSGVIRIYGAYDNGGSSTQFYRSIRETGDDFKTFGYRVEAAGDFNTDGQGDLIITAPGSKINGMWGAGKAYIYELSELELNGNGDSAGSPLRTIEGIPQQNAQLGGEATSLLPGGDIHAEASAIFVAKVGWAPPGNNDIGSLHTFDIVNLGPANHYRLVGNSSGASLGTSLTHAPDLDSDGMADFVIGSPGARCDGKPWGAARTFSVLDQVFSHQICAEYNNSDLGKIVNYFDGVNSVMIAKKGQLFVSNEGDFLRHDDISTNTSHDTYFGNNSYKYFGWEYGNVSEPGQGDETWERDLLVSDAGAWNSAANEGKVEMFSTSGSNLTKECEYRGDEEGARLGAGIAFIPDINGDSFRDIVIGVPSADVGGGATGKIYIVDGSRGAGDCESSNQITINDASPLVLLKLEADDTVIQSVLSKPAEGNFGYNVIGLDDFDGVGPNKAYFYVSNTNSKMPDNTGTPQYFIFATDGSSISYVRHETGITGSNLGLTARLVNDINGDASKDIMIGNPGGVGVYGETGSVIVLSGAGLGDNTASTSTHSNDILQILYNPDNNQSNFGVSVDFADISGDGIGDFVIGADGFDSDDYQDAGAVYVFPVKPILE